MRIDLYASGEAGGPTEVGVAGAVGTASGHQNVATAVSSTADTDRTTLSTGSQSVSSLTSQALAAGTERSARVESLRQSVNSGDYQLEPDAIAQAILKDRA
jgi:flagellar biosynthesis anti-sigma factor FlgM